MFALTSKKIFGLVALFCLGLFSASLILQYFVFVVPCPLCIVQRYTYLFIFFLSALAYFGRLDSLRIRLYGITLFFLASFGEAIAVRQVWIQYHASSADPTKCTVTFGSFFDSVLIALGGAGSCSRVDWTLFSFSLAEWSMLCFSGLLLISLVLFFQFSSSQVEVEQKNNQS